MTNLFIDTNVFLNFYGFSRDHLGKLERLKDLIRRKDILLFLPEQVIDEIERNRESRLKVAIDHLENLGPKLQIPTFCRDVAEIKEMQKRVEDIQKLSRTVVNNLEKEIKTRTHQTDKLIAEILSLGNRIPLSPGVIDVARTRYDRGNPPGKAGSYGDAINWEVLLDVCPKKEDLYFVGGDKDFKSVLNPDDFSPFLINEWRSKKESNVFYYELISEFIKQKFAEVQITDEQIKEEKKVAAESLPLSGTYGMASMPISGTMGYLSAFLAQEKLARCPYCGFEFNTKKGSSLLALATGTRTVASMEQCPGCHKSFIV